LSDARLRELIAVNDWLAHTNGGKTSVVPVRYRPAEIFGDEKCLDGMVRTHLFGPGRLSLDLLACVRIPAPLPSIAVGPGPDLLVVENNDTYWVAADTLPNGHGHGHRIGAVAWGCGNAFPSQVAAPQHRHRRTWARHRNGLILGRPRPCRPHYRVRRRNCRSRHRATRNQTRRSSMRDSAPALRSPARR
jgi:hypothetical protein